MDAGATCRVKYCERDTIQYTFGQEAILSERHDRLAFSTRVHARSCPLMFICPLIFHVHLFIPCMYVFCSFLFLFCSSCTCSADIEEKQDCLYFVPLYVLPFYFILYHAILYHFVPSIFYLYSCSCSFMYHSCSAIVVSRSNRRKQHGRNEVASVKARYIFPNAAPSSSQTSMMSRSRYLSYVAYERARQQQG